MFIWKCESIKAAGEAVRRKNPCTRNLEAPDAPDFQLTPEQLEKTKHLTVVFSAPIMKLKKMQDGKFYPTDDVIGVLNIDTSRSGAYEFYNKTPIPDKNITLRKEVEKVQKILVEQCSWIMN